MSIDSKFVFDTDYQLEIIKFIVLDPNGHQALKLVEENYFVLVDHQVIVSGLKKFYTKVGRTPKNKIHFKSVIKTVLKSKKYAQALKEDDRKKILRLSDSIFKGRVKDSDLIFESCKKFASFVQVKKIVEEFDITNFNDYEAVSNKFQRAVTVGIELEEDSGEYVFRNIANRQFDRKHSESTKPTPFNQLNRIFNGDGTPTESVVTVIDKGKGGKTCFLVNVGRSYAKMRKRVVVFDLENGESNYAIRYEQSLANSNKRSIMNGSMDAKLQRLSRKYIRLGCEVVIKRFPAGTTTREFDKFLEDSKANGYVFEVCIIDYVGIMGSTTGKQDDKDRISDAYLDVKNLAHRWKFDVVWTGHHITREAYKRRPTRYEPTDTAKCIDVNRHVDAMFGINQNDEEKAAGVIRLEVVDIRDGIPDGKAYFWWNIENQRSDEFTKNQIEEYQKQEKVDVKSNKGRGADI